MEPTIIGIKQLHKELTKVARATKQGKSFIVVKHAKPVFRIEPVTLTPAKSYSLADFMKIQFSGGDTNLSEHIDDVLYPI